MFPELLSQLCVQIESWSPQPGVTIQRAFLRTEGDAPLPSPAPGTFETMLCVDGQVDLRLADGQARSVLEDNHWHSQWLSSKTKSVQKRRLTPFLGRFSASCVVRSG